MVTNPAGVARLRWFAPALIAAALYGAPGCSTAQIPLTTAQSHALVQAQQIADAVTSAYAVPRVHVRASASSAHGRAAGTYSYADDSIVLSRRSLDTRRFDVVLSHELGHATLRHRPVTVSLPREDAARALQTGGNIALPPDVREEIAGKERAANHRGVEILVRFFGLTEDQALERYTGYFVEANRNRFGLDVLLPLGHPMPCQQLRALWASFDRPAPLCELAPDLFEITECPYDDWMSTGCKAGQLLERE